MMYQVIVDRAAGKYTVYTNQLYSIQLSSRDAWVLGPVEFGRYRSGTGTGRFGWYQTSTAIFFSCWIKVAKTFVKNGYILKSENLEMLFFILTSDIDN